MRSRDSLPHVHPCNVTPPLTWGFVPHGAAIPLRTLPQAFMSSYSPDYAPALLLRTPPSWAAAEARARGGTRRGQTQGSAQPELLRARAEAFVRMWRRRALFIGPGARGMVRTCV